MAAGARLSLETRFARFFSANSPGNPNEVLAIGDPVMDDTVDVTGSLRGPFKGKSMNCRACHPPPHFSDFNCHNIGTSQSEFDSVHGTGQSAALLATLPTLATRTDADLPASASDPSGLGKFLSVPQIAAPERTDLGLWNVFANPHVPGPQAGLTALLGASTPPTNGDLAGTVALFKTPALRDLGQSAPYFHTGQEDATADVILH